MSFDNDSITMCYIICTYYDMYTFWEAGAEKALRLGLKRKAGEEERCAAREAARQEGLARMCASREATLARRRAQARLKTEEKEVEDIISSAMADVAGHWPTSSGARVSDQLIRFVERKTEADSAVCKRLTRFDFVREVRSHFSKLQQVGIDLGRSTFLSMLVYCSY